MQRFILNLYFFNLRYQTAASLILTEYRHTVRFSVILSVLFSVFRGILACLLAEGAAEVKLIRVS